MTFYALYRLLLFISLSNVVPTIQLFVSASLTLLSSSPPIFFTFATSLATNLPPCRSKDVRGPNWINIVEIKGKLCHQSLSIPFVQSSFYFICVHHFNIIISGIQCNHMKKEGFDLTLRVCLWEILHILSAKVNSSYFTYFHV